MKKFSMHWKRTEGQKEKNPAKAKEAKPPKVETLLLQTYLTSLLCLVLCVTMFFGTSYAWFTSEVSNSSNEIYVGTLQVGLHTRDGRNLTDSENNKLFDQNICWEPGYTTLDTLLIANEGELAFRYELSFTDGSLLDSRMSELNDVANCFEVWVYDHAKNGGAPAVSSYMDINTDNGWEEPVGLDKVLAGKSVLDGQLRPEDDTDSDKMATEHEYTIALHMKEDATAEVMGSRIELNVKLIAYQMSYETDALGNDGYDNIVMVSDAEGLKTELNNGSHIQLTSDISIDSVEACVTVDGEAVEGNGRTVSYNGEENIGIVSALGGKISNLYIIGGEYGTALYVPGLNSHLDVSGCVFDGENAFVLDSGAAAGSAVIRFKDTAFDAPSSYANAAQHVYFDSCRISGVMVPCGDTTITDCEIGADCLDLSGLEEGETVTLINCTYGGQWIEKTVLTSGSATVA